MLLPILYIGRWLIVKNTITMNSEYLVFINKLIDDLAECVIDAALDKELYKDVLSERDFRWSLTGILEYGFIDIKDLFLLDTRELLLKFISATEEDINKEPLEDSSQVMGRSYQFYNFGFDKMVMYICEFKSILTDVLYINSEVGGTKKSEVIIDTLFNIAYMTEYRYPRNICIEYKDEILKSLGDRYKEVNMELTLSKKEFSDDEKKRNKLIQNKIYIVERILLEFISSDCGRW